MVSAEHAALFRRLVNLRTQAMKAGLRPLVILVGPELWPGFRSFGLMWHPQDAPGLALLARRPRRFWPRKLVRIDEAPQPRGDTP